MGYFSHLESDQEYVYNDTFNGHDYFKNKGGYQIFNYYDLIPGGDRLCGLLCHQSI